MMDKTVKVLVRKAEQQGFRIEHTSKGRVVFLAPDGVTSVVGCSDVGDGRALKNLTAQLRRAGLQDRPVKKEKPVPSTTDWPDTQVLVAEQLNPVPAVAPAPVHPWAHWTDEQVAHLRTQGYTAEFILRRTGR